MQIASAAGLDLDYALSMAGCASRSAALLGAKQETTLEAGHPARASAVRQPPPRLSGRVGRATRLTKILRALEAAQQSASALNQPRSVCERRK